MGDKQTQANKYTGALHLFNGLTVVLVIAALLAFALGAHVLEGIMSALFTVSCVISLLLEWLSRRLRKRNG